MFFQYKEAIREKWQQFSLIEQLANIGSEVSRSKNWQGEDKELFWGAVERALELFNLTLEDVRWKRELKEEVIKVKELFCDAVLDGKEYKTNLEDLDKYFLYFGFLARRDV